MFSAWKHKRKSGRSLQGKTRKRVVVVTFETGPRIQQIWSENFVPHTHSLTHTHIHTHTHIYTHTQHGWTRPGPPLMCETEIMCDETEKLEKINTGRRKSEKHVSGFLLSSCSKPSRHLPLGLGGKIWDQTSIVFNILLQLPQTDGKGSWELLLNNGKMINIVISFNYLLSNFPPSCRSRKEKGHEAGRGRASVLLLSTKQVFRCLCVDSRVSTCLCLCVCVSVFVCVCAMFLRHTSSLSRVFPNSRWCRSKMEEPWSLARGLPDLETHTDTHTDKDTDAHKHTSLLYYILGDLPLTWFIPNPLTPKPWSNQNPKTKS